ncbi:MAG: hypothetical protein IJB77_04075 [Bacteroidaceae bacterium]|nr:hypothetical protein [Bacteroidaceae bacterium]
MKIKNYIYLLLMLLATLLPTACNDNIQLPANDDDGKVHWTIGVSLPGAEQNITRGFGDEGTGSGGYFEFKDLYVAVFVNIEGVSYLEEFVRADNTVPTWNAENNCWDFGVTLNQTDGPRRLHLIANYPGLTMGFGEEGQLVGRLMANGADHDVYWNYRDVEKVAEGFQAQVQMVPLVRNYVKIELEDSIPAEDKFQLEAYALYNVPTKGTVAPYNPGSISMFANYVDVDSGKCQSYENLSAQGYKGNEPYDDGTLLSKEINWVAPGTPSYIYERSNRNSDTPTCMLIKGKYDGGNTTYYKLDFVHLEERDGATVKVYYNLLRNFIYTMNLNSVKSEGYATVEQAIKQPASNNISGDAIAKDYTNISDGEGRLFVSTTGLLFTDNTPKVVYFKYIPNLQSPNTTNNGAVVVSAPMGDVLSKAAEIAATDETEGIHKGWRKMTLTPNAPGIAGVFQEIAVSAGGLQRHVELLLREPYNLAVAVDPKTVETGAKKSLTVNITLPGGLPESIFPLRLFISSEDNTIYPDYGTNMPAEAQNGKYGFIREVSLLEYQDSTSYACKFLTNCEESATTVYVDNEYFNRGSDKFGNPWRNSVTLGTSIAVDVERIYGRYPKNIYGTNGNNGTQSVTVTLNGVELTDKITIDYNNVTNGITFENSEGLNSNDEVVFTFTDYYWYGDWSTTPITYKATATLGEIYDGTTLEFRAEGEINKITTITIPSSQPVEVERTYYRYPSTLYSRNEVEVTVKFGTNVVGIFKIDSDRDEVWITANAELYYSEGLNSTDTLTFTFKDTPRYADTQSTYTAECTVADLMEGKLLNFEY